MVIYIELCCFTIYPTAILSAICIEFSIHEFPAIDLISGPEILEHSSLLHHFMIEDLLCLLVF